MDLFTHTLGLFTHPNGALWINVNRQRLCMSLHVRPSDLAPKCPALAKAGRFGLAVYFFFFFEAKSRVLVKKKRIVGLLFDCIWLCFFFFLLKSCRFFFIFIKHI
ncbi:hypothetical protein Hanom_Chr14g01320131 [Helianthus anomalus]